MKQLLLLIPAILFFGCEQPKEEVEDEETEYYNCIAYMNDSNITQECVAISSGSPIDWLYETEADCLNACGNYNCVGGDCLPEEGGQYSEQADCLTACDDNNTINYGYSCLNYDCVFEAGGQYETFLDCVNVCSDYGYNCIGDDCFFQENGQYETFESCYNVCNYGYNCIDGTCVFEENGQYDTFEDCSSNCIDYEGQVLFYFYDGVPALIYENTGETTVHFDIGDENNLNFIEVGSLSTINQSGYLVSPLCIENTTVLLIDLDAPEIGSQTYTWRVRNWLDTELYDFGTFEIANGDCISISVDLVQ